MMRRVLGGISAFAWLLIGCQGVQLIGFQTPGATPTWTPSPRPSSTQPDTPTPIAFPTHTPTTTPTETPLPTFTSAPTLTLTPQWIMQGPGKIVVPILLYHHVGYSSNGDTVYYVRPQAFDQEMNLLYQWGYRTISVELLARALREGAELPPKPVILTFDDGGETTYSTALPIMQRYGFTGVSYIVYNYVGKTNYMNTDQIRALYAAGWEIGSHGLSHADLTARPDRQMDEIVQSRWQLEDLIGVPILSFAYPFGAYDSDALHYVHTAGYIAALGLGNETLQGKDNLFYLYRQAVRGTDDLRALAGMLPWREEQIDLPPVTIVP